MVAIVATGIMARMEKDHDPGSAWPTPNKGGLKAEIAAAAAYLIAEEGLDYASAKRKAYTRVTGGRGHRVSHEALPSNEDLEQAVRDYQSIFQSEHQPARCSTLRKKALELMRLLAEFSPMVTGAIVNGTAGEHSDIHLQCFVDNAKALGIFLLNQNIKSDAASLPHNRKGQPPVEALVIQWMGELAVIAVYPEVDARGARRPDATGRLQRLDCAGLEALLQQSDLAQPNPGLNPPEQKRP